LNQYKLQVINNYISKVLSILLIFYIVSLTTENLSKIEYGKWSLYFNLIFWAGFFDFGISSIFKTILAKSKQKKQFHLESYFVGYIIVGAIVFFWSCFAYLLSMDRILLYTTLSLICIVFFGISRALWISEHKVHLIQYQLCFQYIMFILISINENKVESLCGNLLLSVFLTNLFFAIYFDSKYLKPYWNNINLKRIKRSLYFYVRKGVVLKLGLMFFILQILSFGLYNSVRYGLVAIENLSVIAEFDLINRFSSLFLFFIVPLASPLWVRASNLKLSKEIDSFKADFNKILLFWLLLTLLFFVFAPYVRDVIFLLFNVLIESDFKFIYSIVIISSLTGFVMVMTTFLNGYSEIGYQIKSFSISILGSGILFFCLNGSPLFSSIFGYYILSLISVAILTYIKVTKIINAHIYVNNQLLGGGKG
jgi:hypothetical protein